MDIGSVSLSVSEAGPSVKHYFRITFLNASGKYVDYRYFIHIS